jgi:predicted nucleotidyltransferase
MIQQSDNALSTIKGTVLSVVPGARVLLFGSRARGEASPASDYDLLVVLERPLDVKSKFALRTHLRKLLLEKGIRSDVLVQSDEEIQRKRQLPGHIVRSALREGVPL